MVDLWSGGCEFRGGHR